MESDILPTTFQPPEECDVPPCAYPNAIIFHKMHTTISTIIKNGH